MLNKTSLVSLAVGALFTLASSNTFAITTQERGLEIAVEAKQRDSGWVDNTADLSMYLRNKQGQESIRELNIKTFEEKNDGDKSLTLFNKPRDVKGTAFLSYSHPTVSE